MFQIACDFYLIFFLAYEIEIGGDDYHFLFFISFCFLRMKQMVLTSHSFSSFNFVIFSLVCERFEDRYEILSLSFFFETCRDGIIDILVVVVDRWIDSVF